MSRNARSARALARRLDAGEVLDAMAFTEAEMENLSAIGSGLPVRGAAQILSALRLKADYLLQKPAQRVDMRAAGVIRVLDPYSIPPGEVPEVARSESADRPRNLAELKAKDFLRQRETILLAAPVAAVAAVPMAADPETGST